MRTILKMIGGIIQFPGLLAVFTLPLLSSCAYLNNADLRPPSWWDNPHKDDFEFMYEKANSEGLGTEHEAREKALENACSMLSKRIYSNLSSENGRVRLSSQYAFSDIQTAGEETQKVAGKWNTWILIKYPQKEKLELIKRIEKGSRNLIDIESLSSKFETCFKINVNTRAGRTDYREGEEIQFDILSERDCYIAVFDHRSDGSSILVYPNRWSLNMMIPANQMLTLPIQERDKFKFVVTPPFGDDVIQVIGCTQKSLLFERISKEVQTGSGNVTAVERGMIVRGLSENTTRSMDQKTEWSEKHFVISTFK